MSDPNTSHYFVSLPASDSSLARILTTKELVSLGLGLGAPMLFALKLLKAEQLGKHSLLWVLFLILWLLLCGVSVIYIIRSAIKIRQYARAVDFDSVALGRNLYNAEREVFKTTEAILNDHSFLRINVSAIQFEDVALPDRVSDEDVVGDVDEVQSEKSSNSEFDNDTT